MSGVSAIDEILRYRWSTLTALCTFCHPACDNGFDTPTESFIDTYSNFAFAICFLSFLGSFRLREWIQQLSTIYTRKWDWLWIESRQPLSARPIMTCLSCSPFKDSGHPDSLLNIPLENFSETLIICLLPFLSSQKGRNTPKYFRTSWDFVPAAGGEVWQSHPALNTK